MIKEFRGETKWLSNFSKFPNGKTVEHYYQAAKASNPSTRKYIAHLPSPGQAKRAGQVCAMIPGWEVKKYRVMYRLLLYKFRDPAIRQLLLDTEDQYLEEGNTWHDRCWGVCYCSQCKGTGKNVLGKMIMLIRKNIRRTVKNDLMLL